MNLATFPTCTPGTASAFMTFLMVVTPRPPAHRSLSPYHAAARPDQTRPEQTRTEVDPPCTCRFCFGETFQLHFNFV